MPITTMATIKAPGWTNQTEASRPTMCRAGAGQEHRPLAQPIAEQAGQGGGQGRGHGHPEVEVADEILAKAGLAEVEVEQQAPHGVAQAGEQGEQKETADWLVKSGAGS